MTYSQNKYTNDLIFIETNFATDLISDLINFDKNHEKYNILHNTKLVTSYYNFNLALNAPLLKVILIASSPSSPPLYTLIYDQSKFDWSPSYTKCQMVCCNIKIKNNLFSTEEDGFFYYIKFDALQTNVAGFLAHQDSFYDCGYFPNSSASINRVRRWRIYTENSIITPFWNVIQWEDGTFSCDCPGWTKRKERKCKHVIQINKILTGKIND